MAVNSLPILRGISSHDPMFEIRWPISEVVLSEKDISYEYVK